MLGWTADFTNDPNNDFNLIVEISYDNKDVAVIKQGSSGLELKWYANDNELIVPLDWLLALMNEANKNLRCMQSNVP